MTDEDTRSKFTQLLTDCTQQLRHVLPEDIGFVIVLTNGDTICFNSNLKREGVEQIVGHVAMRVMNGPCDAVVELPEVPDA